MAALKDALPDASTRRRVLLGAPSLLEHASLDETLPAKLSTIATVTNLPAERAVYAAPALLMLDATQLAARRQRLADGLPPEMMADPAVLDGMLRRAPRLLLKKPEAVVKAFDELTALLPDECNAVKLIAAQPTLLARDRDKLKAKLNRLRELCTDAEWANLCVSASLGRALTAGDAVVERLARRMERMQVLHHVPLSRCCSRPKRIGRQGGGGSRPHDGLCFRFGGGGMP